MGDTSLSIYHWWTHRLFLVHTVAMSMGVQKQSCHGTVSCVNAQHGPLVDTDSAIQIKMKWNKTPAEKRKQLVICWCCREPSHEGSFLPCRGNLKLD